MFKRDTRSLENSSLRVKVNLVRILITPLNPNMIPVILVSGVPGLFFGGL